MIKRVRLCPEDRREAILASARKVFAKKGLEGTSTRDLARAAGVTQPLFYHYFPSKEALYRAMLKTVGDTALLEAEPILSQTPSTQTLIALVEFIVSWQLSGRSPEREILFRHLFQSLMNNGRFAKEALKSPVSSTLMEKLQQGMTAAIASGDLDDYPVTLRLRAHLTKQAAFGLRLYCLPSTPVVDYGLSRPELVRQSTWFLLRGIGLQERCIQRYFNASLRTLS